MNPIHVLRGAGLAFLAVCLAAPAFSQGGPNVRVHLNAPTGALGLVDSPSNEVKIYEHDATIPYGTIGSAISNQVKGLANTHGDLEGDVSAGYIDYHYKVDSTASFAFTQTNQPTITVLSVSQNKVRIAVHTEAKLSFKATGSATTSDHIPAPPFTEYPDFDGTLRADAIFKLDGTADIAIWPTVTAENVSVVLSGGKPNVTITGLDGDMTAFSVGVGTAIGFSPGGLMVGGPAVLSLAALLGSNAAYDAAVTTVRDKLAAGLEKAVEKANAEIKKKIKAELEPIVAAANDVRNNALSTTIPGIGASVNGLQAQAGASLDVRTKQAGAGTITVVTVRFDGQPRGGKATGKFRFPKAKCHKVELNVGGYTNVQGFFEEANADLNAGMACSQVVASNGLGIRAFLGGKPPGTSLAMWKNVSGQLKGVGVVRENTSGQTDGLEGDVETGYYECDFEVTGLPLGVLAFTSKGGLSNRLKDYVFSGKRHWVFPGAPSWTEGGAGKCEGTGSSGGLTLNPAAEFKRKIDNCPECGPMLRDKLGEQVIQPADGVLKQPGAMQGPGTQKLKMKRPELNAPSSSGAPGAIQKAPAAGKTGVGNLPAAGKTGAKRTPSAPTQAGKAGPSAAPADTKGAVKMAPGAGANGGLKKIAPTEQQGVQR